MGRKKSATLPRRFFSELAQLKVAMFELKSTLEISGPAPPGAASLLQPAVSPGTTTSVVGEGVAAPGLERSPSPCALKDFASFVFVSSVSEAESPPAPGSHLTFPRFSPDGALQTEVPALAAYLGRNDTDANCAALLFAADTLENMMGRVRGRLKDAIESANWFCDAVVAAPLSDAAAPSILQVLELLHAALDDDNGLSIFLSGFDRGALRVAHARLLAHLLRSHPPPVAVRSKCSPSLAPAPPAPLPGHSSHIVMVHPLDANPTPPARRAYSTPGGGPTIVSARPSLPDAPVDRRCNIYSQRMGYYSVNPLPPAHYSPSATAPSASPTPSSLPQPSPVASASAPRCDECRGCFACATLRVESGCDSSEGPSDRFTILYERVKALEKFGREHVAANPLSPSNSDSSSGSNDSDSSSGSSASIRRRRRRYAKRQAVSVQDQGTQTEAATPLSSRCCATVLRSFRHDQTCPGYGAELSPSLGEEEFSSGFASDIDEGSDSSSVTVIAAPAPESDRSKAVHSWPAIFLLFLAFVLSSCRELLSGTVTGLSAVLDTFPSAAVKSSRCPRILRTARPRVRLKGRRAPFVIVHR